MKFVICSWKDSSKNPHGKTSLRKILPPENSPPKIPPRKFPAEKSTAVPVIGQYVLQYIQAPQAL